MHDCLRCGRPCVIDEREFCINCLTKWEKLINPIIKTMKILFIDDYWN